MFTTRSVPATNQLHRVIERPIFAFSEFVYGHDRRVRQLAGDLRFADESSDGFGREIGMRLFVQFLLGGPVGSVGRLWQEFLERNIAHRVLVIDQENSSHASSGVLAMARVAARPLREGIAARCG